MRKLTKNELKRNGLYETIAQADFEDYDVLGHVKQGILMRGKVDKEDVIVKVILKKAQVDFTSEQIERPIEQAKEENTKDEKEDTKEE
jgi:hypothetical protein